MGPPDSTVMLTFLRSLPPLNALSPIVLVRLFMSASFTLPPSPPQSVC